MFEPITCFKCQECGMIYEKVPDKCQCRHIIVVPGTVINSFKVVGIIRPGECIATCMLCDMNGEHRISDLRKMVSCGCRPSHIEILEIKQNTIKYRCKRCSIATLVHPPILTYCCDDVEGD